MNARLLLRMMRRQSRGAAGRLVFFATCIAFGVAALVGVGALVDAIEQSLRDNSRALLGGDIEIESRRQLPDVAPHLPEAYADVGRVDITVMPTMAQNPAGESRLVQLKAIDIKRGRYPLAGELGLDPPGDIGQLLTERTVIATPEMLQQLHVKTGDTIKLGGQPYEIVARITRRPQRLQFSFGFGPELLMTQAGLQRAGLLGYGNRLRFRTLLGLPDDTSVQALHDLKRHLEKQLPGGGSFVTIETHDQAQPRLRRTLERVRQYLGLVALLSLLLGCVGVAQIVSTWIARAAPETAVLRCLGLRPRDVLMLHLGHVLLTAIAGSLAGGVLGLLTPYLAASAYPELIEMGVLQHVAWGALGRGVAVGAMSALLFCVPPLTAVYRVSPALVLRSEAAPLPVPNRVRTLSLSLAAAGIYLAAYSQAQNARLALIFSAGVVALTIALWGGARLLQLVVARLPRRRLPPLLWQGAAALVRPGAGTTGSIVALGLGTLVVLGITLVERVIDAEVATALPTDAPSVFLADVQPDQWDGIVTLAEQHGGRRIQSAPVVMGRISKLNSLGVEQLIEMRTKDSDSERVRWVLTREQRITWRAEMADNNVLTQGQWFYRPDVPEISVEQDYADDLGVGINSRIELDIQGVPMEFVVTSIRNVEWRSFEPNFFLIVEPGYLDDAPMFRIGAMRLPADQEGPLQDAIADRYPNVTIILVRAIIERVSAILDQVALGVRLLGGFAVLTGLIILVGAVAATQLRRAREAALLKTLGLSRARVAWMFAFEYALRGLVAGGLGAVGAYALSLGFTRGVLQMQALPSVGLCIAAVFAATLLSVVGGLLASLRALLVKPLQVLRQDA